MLITPLQKRPHELKIQKHLITNHFCFILPIKMTCDFIIT